MAWSPLHDVTPVVIGQRRRSAESADGLGKIETIAFQTVECELACTTSSIYGAFERQRKA